MSSPPTGAGAQRRGTMEPPAITPSPRGILRPSGSFKKRQLERLRLEEAEEREAAVVQPRPRVGQRLFAGDDDERPCPWRRAEGRSVDDDAAAREAVKARAASSGRARDRREARERAEPGDENATGWGSHLKISDDDPRAREDDLRVGRAALSLEAEVREVDALVDALRGMCDGASESDGDGPGFSDEVNEVDESDASFRSAEEEPGGGRRRRGKRRVRRRDVEPRYRPPPRKPLRRIAVPDRRPRAQAAELGHLRRRSHHRARHRVGQGPAPGEADVHRGGHPRVGQG